MKITINGEVHTLDEALTIADLLAQFAIRDDKGVAVALNLKVIPKSRFDNTMVNEGDRIDIIHATAGG
jgi:thiamine biosynthesis protein ThiS